MIYSPKPSALSPKPNSRRLFIAIHLHDEARHKTAGLLHELPFDRSLKFVPEENLHLTLVFIGNMPERQIPLIEEAIEEASKPVKPFTLTFTKLGAFPNFREPHVIWFGLEEPTGQLKSLDQRLKAALEKRRIHLIDSKPFLPHLTLARVKGPLSSEVVPELERIAAARHSIPQVDVSSIELMESKPGAGSPEYLELYRHLL
jgi:2'-5' RNA ligase